MNLNIDHLRAQYQQGFTPTKLVKQLATLIANDIRMDLSINVR